MSHPNPSPCECEALSLVWSCYGTQLTLGAGASPGGPHRIIRVLKSGVLALAGSRSWRDSKCECAAVCHCWLCLWRRPREGMCSLKELREGPQWLLARKQWPQPYNCKELTSANSLNSFKSEIVPEPPQKSLHARPTPWPQPCETLKREPSRAHLDFWPKEPWVHKWVLSYTPKFVLFFYIAIENWYSQEKCDQNI